MLVPVRAALIYVYILYIHNKSICVCMFAFCLICMHTCAAVAAAAPRGKAQGKRPSAEDQENGGKGEANEDDEPEFKKRNRAIAQSRAAAFAMGRGFVDDADHEKKKPAGGQASGGAASKKGKKDKDKADGVAAQDGALGGAGDEEEERESWPGPWSTATALYSKRDAAVEARKGAGAGTDKKVVIWQPTAGKGSTTHARAIPTLQGMCIDMVATHIDACLEHGLGSILPDMKAKICENLCKKRRLLPDVLPIFTDRETAVLSLPDCSYIGEQEMAAAFQRCQGPALEVCVVR